MKIAIVTGASSGMGKEFVRQLSYCYPWLDEIWAIARREKPMKELQKEVSVKLRILPMDLLQEESANGLEELLRRKKPYIKVLVNAAGFGKVGKAAKIAYGENQEMIGLNCGALTKITCLCLAYCQKSSRVIQLASAAAFVPQPGFAVYAATKSYVVSFTRALRKEVRGDGITVTAVCPGPVKTEFFKRAGEAGQMSLLKSFTMASPKKVVHQAICDAAKGREFSIYGWHMKAIFFLCKVLPHKLLLFLMDYLL